MRQLGVVHLELEVDIGQGTPDKEVDMPCLNLISKSF